MAASMTSEMGSTDRIIILMEECRRMSIEVLPPDVNESELAFSVVGDKIRFGSGGGQECGARRCRGNSEGARGRGTGLNRSSISVPASISARLIAGRLSRW